MSYTLADIIKWAQDHDMSMQQIMEEARRLPLIMTNLQASRYLSAAGMIVVLYDTILTLPDEFRFIWPMSFGVIKSIWFLSRYVVPGLIVLYNYQFFQARPAMSDEFCQVYISGLSWCLNISFAASNWLLLLRVSALWGRKRAVIWPLYFCYFALYVVISVIVGLAVARMSKRLAYNPIIGACMFTERIPANLIHSQWLPIVFDVVIFILTLVKAKQDNIALRKGSRGNAPVLFILFRDGGIYCVVIIALRIFNFVAWAFLDESMVYLAMGFLWAIVTALINRFYLNLRRVAYATAAALLTNGSIRERPIAPGSGRLRELIEGNEMARRGAQSPGSMTMTICP
ncbi:SubName: Full=Uncharacterized protein {ECO:0000313/EMBL:CCA69802.1} [Serendipita indica DSM 11827]|nr:SubName: Full=Uncharacterized protein {ECO:0000313/EMBL:CCA69802.1} [Serendipita indica DSM 11827]